MAPPPELDHSSSLAIGPPGLQKRKERGHSSLGVQLATKCLSLATPPGAGHAVIRPVVEQLAVFEQYTLSNPTPYLDDCSKVEVSGAAMDTLKPLRVLSGLEGGKRYQD